MNSRPLRFCPEQIIIEKAEVLERSFQDSNEQRVHCLKESPDRSPKGQKQVVNCTPTCQHGLSFFFKNKSPCESLGSLDGGHVWSVVRDD